MAKAVPPEVKLKIMPIQLLSELDDRALARHVAHRRYPKWWTLCILRSLGHPVLNGCCIEPGQSDDTLQLAAERLSQAVRSSQLLLRSDGGVETARYYRGGSTFSMDQLLPRARELLDKGRAVILLEPTNRFTNRLSVTLRLDRPNRYSPGTLILEALGPGYDVSDLSRGGLLPQITIVVNNVDWRSYESLWWSDLRVSVQIDPKSDYKRRQQRLDRLADHILPDLGELPHGSDKSAVEQWLRAMGYTGLWSAWDPLRLVASMRRWYEDAFVVGHALDTSDWQCLCLSASNLGGRTVFWDVVNGQRKFGAQL
jgi:hypothetical protein